MRQEDSMGQHIDPDAHISHAARHRRDIEADEQARVGLLETPVVRVHYWTGPETVTRARWRALDREHRLNGELLGVETAMLAAETRRHVDRELADLRSEVARLRPLSPAERVERSRTAQDMRAARDGVLLALVAFSWVLGVVFGVLL
jgi:hypothetical protein